MYLEHHLYHIRRWRKSEGTMKKEKAADEVRKFHNILAVKNYDSEVSSFYKILTPIQITVESCTGLSSNDRYEVSLYSPGGSWSKEEKVDQWFSNLSARTQHRHDYFELLIVLEGEIIQQIEGREYPYRAGTCCLINRNIMHTERFTGAAKICFLGFSADFVRAVLRSTPELYFADENKLKENCILQFMRENLKQDVVKEYQDLFPVHDNINSSDVLSDFSQKIVDILKNPKIGATYYIIGLICQLLAYLEGNFYVTPVRLNSSADSLLFLRIQHLLEDTNGRITRSELAEILHYNGSYLNDVVRKYTGMCLFDYGMTFCFAKAAELLLHTDYPVNEIAAMLRFSNRTHFYTLFRRRFGMTPNEYRIVHAAQSNP